MGVQIPSLPFKKNKGIVDNGNSYFMQVQRFYLKPRTLKGMYADFETHWELTQWDDYIVTHWMHLPTPPDDK